MKSTRLLIAALSLCVQGAGAQTPSGFDGDWTVNWSTKSAVLEAKLSIHQNAGTWRTLIVEKFRPCSGREAPIQIEERTDTQLVMTLRFSEALQGCTDEKVSLQLAADGTVSGKRGRSELKLTRVK